MAAKKKKGSANKKAPAKISVREKLHYTKPLKKCEPALADIRRIRNNEQAKVRRLKAKVESLPKRMKGRKKEAEKINKDIRSRERAISGLKKTIKGIGGACKIIDSKKSQIKSLKLKASAVDRKIKRMPKDKIGTAEYKKLQNEALKYLRDAKTLQKDITAVLYDVNKGLGFAPEVVAERLKMSKKDLIQGEKAGDFSEEYFEEEFEELPPEEEGEPEEGVPSVEEILEGEEIEIDRFGYVDVLDDIFWQVSQDFTKNESKQLGKYNQIVIKYAGKTQKFSGNEPSMITMAWDAMIRWAETQPPYVRITKEVTLDQTKIKYTAYQT